MALAELLGNVRNKVTSLVNQNDDVETVKDLDELLRKAREARRPYEGQWLLNLAFYFGKQWVIWSQATQQLERPSVEPWRVMPNINFIRPAVLTAYAKIVKNRQAARTQPAGANPPDEAAARACDKLLDYLWPITKSENALKKATIWMLITGTGLTKARWDKQWGPVVGQDPETQDDLHLGEVQTDPISPFDFYIEPGALEIEEAEWCFHVTIRPASYVKKMWGKDVDETDYDNSMTFESQMKMIITGDPSKVKGAVVKEFYRRPTADYPDGQFIVYANEEIMENKANPYKDDLPLPFFPIRGNPRPDSFWGIPFVDDMIDPQRIYNKTSGEAIEIQRLMSKPKWLIPIGSLMEGEEVTNAPGEDIRYTPTGGMKPEPTKGIDIPSGYFKLLDTTRSELYDTSGQHEISHGQSPYTRTAAGIAYLQEQDDARLAPMIRNYDTAYELMEAGKLSLARIFYDPARSLTIMGKDNKTEVMTFYKNMIPNEVHVHIQAGGQALPRSRVARQDLILKLWTTQPPLLDDPKLALKMLEFGEIEGIFDTLNEDISQAERENTAMLQIDAKKAEMQMQQLAQQAPTPGPDGMPVQPPPPGAVPVKKFHNHPVHIKEHNKIRNSLTYEEADPTVQMAMDYHVDQHESIYAQMMMTMQMNQAAALTGGGGGGSGAAGDKPRKAGTGLGDLSEGQAHPAGQYSQGLPTAAATGGGQNAQ